MKTTSHLLMTAVSAALAAGKEILAVYHTDFDVLHKADKSPLTLADQRAHQVIKAHLKSTGIPILSEEGNQIPHEARKDWPRLWIVDPLDGTKEFVKKNDEFTVNIALVENHQPIMGVVYIPVKDRLYLGCRDMGSFRIDQASDLFKQGKDGTSDSDTALPLALKNAEKLPIPGNRPTVYTIVGSRSHATAELESFIEKMRRLYGTINFISAGSALKICLVAEGTAHVYPRLGPTMEWDTAAGQAVAEFAGAAVTNYETDKPLTYNKENLLNPWFVVKRERDEVMM